MQQRVVMHTCDEKIARRLALAFDCAVTLSPNHPADHVTLCGFEHVIDEALEVVRVEAPGWVRADARLRMRRMIPRIVMHTFNEETARRLGDLLDCAVTLSPNHSMEEITMCGFVENLADLLPVLAVEVPGWTIRQAEFR